MPITATYDREADALYVRLTAGARARAVEVDDMTYVDVDAGGDAVGIEFLYPSMRLNLSDPAAQFGLGSQLAAIVAAIAASGAPQPTTTGGSRVASMAIPMVAVEGTLAASDDVVMAASKSAAADEQFIRVGG